MESPEEDFGIFEAERQGECMKGFRVMKILEWMEREHKCIEMPE